MAGRFSFRQAATCGLFMALLSASCALVAAGRPIPAPKPFVPQFDVENPARVDWVCRYSEPRNDEFLHLICESGISDPVAIPIWNYDYGDGMVEQLMRAALCFHSPIPCSTMLNRAGPVMTRATTVRNRLSR